jgi:hypothetical protein
MQGDVRVAATAGEAEEAEDERYTNEIYTTACKAAGVWAKVRQDQAEAVKREARDVSPVPACGCAHGAGA